MTCVCVAVRFSSGVFVPRPAGGRAFLSAFSVFFRSTGKKLFFHRCQNTLQTHTHTYGHTVVHTQTYAFYLFICGYLSGVVGRVSRFWAATFRSSFAPVLKSSSLQLFRRPCCAGIFFSPFFLKKIKSESGWVRGNPPTQHQKWTDESSGCELREGWTGGSKAIFKRKFTVCVPTMK